MAGVFKNIKKFFAMMTVLAVTSILIFSMLPIETKAATAVYKVEFRGGSHGTFSGSNKAVTSAEYNSTLSYIPEPDAVDSGYWFTGYSPQIQNTVVESAVYVAQYAKLIDGVEYCVRYVDTTGASVATEKIAYANDGDVIAAYAKEISGYKSDSAMKTMTAASSGNIITFTYTPAPVTTGNQTGATTGNNQTVYVFQNVPNNAANAGNNAANAAAGNDGNAGANNGAANAPQIAADETNVVPGGDNSNNGDLLPEVAADTDVVPNNQNATGLNSTKLPLWVYISGAVTILAATALAGMTIPKLIKKKDKK